MTTFHFSALEVDSLTIRNNEFNEAFEVEGNHLEISGNPFLWSTMMKVEGADIEFTGNTLYQIPIEYFWGEELMEIPGVFLIEPLSFDFQGGENSFSGNRVLYRADWLEMEPDFTLFQISVGGVGDLVMENNVIELPADLGMHFVSDDTGSIHLLNNRFAGNGVLLSFAARTNEVLLEENTFASSSADVPTVAVQFTDGSATLSRNVFATTTGIEIATASLFDQSYQIQENFFEGFSNGGSDGLQPVLIAADSRVELEVSGN